MTLTASPGVQDPHPPRSHFQLPNNLNLRSRYCRHELRILPNTLEFLVGYLLRSLCSSEKLVLEGGFMQARTGSIFRSLTELFTNGRIDQQPDDEATTSASLSKVIGLFICAIGIRHHGEVFWMEGTPCDATHMEAKTQY